MFTPATDDGSPALTTTGTNIHFRVTGGKYRLIFRGAGIDLTAIGTGVAFINASENAIDAGYFAVDAGDWTAAPLFTIKAVPSGLSPLRRRRRRRSERHPGHPRRRGRELDRLVRRALPEERWVRRPDGREAVPMP